MLQRSFKPAKCKTALKLVGSRIKLLKNKREAQVKQWKREVAQLLESGQDRTARIRVEHVVREEKTLTAYNLIEIYCELIVARLAMIESQKNCPIDLKEAIASLIYASPMCADLPELNDVRKQFAAKYGKEFISAAVEVRPDCGVNRMLVEKLSAIAPDGQTKLKILAEIAEEHNIKWDPELSGEGDFKPHEDLLKGLSSFEVNKLHVEPPNIQVPTYHDAKGPNFHVQANSKERNDAPGNLYEHNRSSLLCSQDLPSTHFGSNEASMSRSSHPDMRASGSGTEGMHLRHSYFGDASPFHEGNQNWNMEFKDATEAAQAAAEAAEQASMAARAAAELSSGGRITRQYSTQSQQSFTCGFRDERHQRYPSSKLEGEASAMDSADDAIRERNRWMNTEQLDSNQQNNSAGVGEKFYRDTTEARRSTSFKSNIESVDNPRVTSPPVADRYSRKNLHGRERNDVSGEISRRKQSNKSELEFLSQDNARINSEDIDYGEDPRSNKRSSRASFSSHSSIVNEDHIAFNSNQYELGSDAGENPFAVFDDGNIQRDTNREISNDNASVAFDQSGSDDDDYAFDVDGMYQGRQSSFYFSSPGRKSPSHRSEITSSWSPRENMIGSLETSRLKSHISMQPNSLSTFSESSKYIEVPLKSHDLLPVTFDDSDGPRSESEEDWNKALFARSKDRTIFPGEQDFFSGDPELTKRKESSFVEKGNVGSKRNPLLQPSFYDPEPLKLVHERNQGSQDSTRSERKSVFGDFASCVLSPRYAKYGLDLNDLVDERNHQQSQQFSRLSLARDEVKDTSQPPIVHDITKDVESGNKLSAESGKEINLRILTGGLRNKSYGLPPYSPSANASTFKRTTENASFKSEKFSVSSMVDTSSNSGSPTQGLNNQKASENLNKKPSSRSSFTYFDDDDDKEEKLSQESFSIKKESSNEKGEVNKKSSSRVPITYFGTNSSEYEEELCEKKLVSQHSPGSGVSHRTKASPRNSDISYMNATVSSEVFVHLESDSRKKFSWRSPKTTDTQPQNEHSDHRGSSEHPETVERVASGPESKKYSSQGSSKSSTTEISGSIDSPRTKTSGAESLTKVNSSKQASHVHPKLPDYDIIIAHLQSMRQNRQ